MVGRTPMGGQFRMLSSGLRFRGSISRTGRKRSQIGMDGKEWLL